jgi:hypothetical protein
MYPAALTLGAVRLHLVSLIRRGWDGSAELCFARLCSEEEAHQARGGPGAGGDGSCPVADRSADRATFSQARAAGRRASLRPRANGVMTLAALNLTGTRAVPRAGW